MFRARVRAATVQSSLSRLDGVRQASVSLDKKSAVVKYDPPKATHGQMIQTIEGAGYKAAIRR